MTAKRYMVIMRHGVQWSYYTPRPELFSKQQAAEYAATIPARYDPRVVTCADYLRLCQSFKDAA